MPINVVNQYPHRIEDGFSKFFLSFIEKLNKKFIPKIIKQYSQEIEVDSLDDILNDLQEMSDIPIEKLKPKVKKWAKDINNFNHTQTQTKINDLTENMGILPISIAKEGELAFGVLENWTELNAKLIHDVTLENGTAISDIALNKLRDDVGEVTSGAIKKSESIRELSRQIKDKTGVIKSKADFWARDQIKLAHRDLTDARLSEAEIPGYIWITVGDRRVRPAHMDYHGQFFKNGAMTIEPGDDFLCRCEKHPAFDESQQLSKTRILKDQRFMRKDEKQFKTSQSIKKLRKTITRTKKFKTVPQDVKTKRIAKLNKQIIENKKKLTKLRT